MDEKLHLIAELLDVISNFGHYDFGYCEQCDRHAPKDEMGALTGDIQHTPACPVGRAAVIVDQHSETIAAGRYYG